jgi:hypothetical protein
LACIRASMDSSVTSQEDSWIEESFGGGSEYGRIHLEVRVDQLQWAAVVLQVYITGRRPKRRRDLCVTRQFTVPLLDF